MACSSTVIQELFSERQPKTAVAYFYFDFRDEKSQHVKVMLQLSYSSPHSLRARIRLLMVYKTSQGQTLLTYETLLGILDELVFGILAYIYALDECNEHDHLVQFITRLQDWTTRSLCLLFTSQHRELLTEAFKHASLVTLTPQVTENDIGRFIGSELHKLSHLTRCVPAGEIIEKIVQKSNGM
jgi:hypothetical protein